MDNTDCLIILELIILPVRWLQKEVNYLKHINIKITQKLKEEKNLKKMIVSEKKKKQYLQFFNKSAKRKNKIFIMEEIKNILKIKLENCE